MPVQFSCHVLGADGAVAHRAWLAEGPGDPREAIARALVAACAGAATVMAWSASVERGCVKRLASFVGGELAGELERVEQKIVDLLELVRGFVYHPGFGGSFSIKTVLPALVPEARGWAGLEVKDGDAASGVLEGMLVRGEGGAGVREEVLRYCERDTEGMVGVWGWMRDQTGNR
jgi:Domain of unknown function(DUF2779)